MDLRNDLVCNDPARRAAAFETAILTALDVDPVSLDFERAARTYRALSDALNGSISQSGGLAPSNTDPLYVSIVLGLIYAARTFHAAHRIFSADPPGSQVAELGAGWGPIGLWSSLRGGSVVLIDATAEALVRAERLGRACEATHQCVRGDASTWTPSELYTAIAVPFALNELPGVDDPTRLRSLVARWAEGLTPNGRLYLIEPGTHVAARRLQQLRDALPPGLHVKAPCRGALCCPQLARASDWCHFTWPLPEAPLARAIAERAQRKWAEQHVSYLVLSRTEPERVGLRVLDVRPHGRAKVVARACGSEGLVTLTALRRASAYAVLSELEPGMVVDVRRATQRGDGLRIETDDDLQVT